MPLPALVLPHFCVCDRAFRSELRKQRVVSFAQPFETKESYWRASIVLYSALLVPPPHQVQVIREDNYILQAQLLQEGKIRQDLSPVKAPLCRHSLKLIDLFTPCQNRDESKLKSITETMSEGELYTRTGN